MKHLFNWVEIPVLDMKRAKTFYSTILETSLQDATIGDIEYAIFSTEDHFNKGALAYGMFYKPSSDGVVIYLNGGDDLDAILSKVNRSGGNVIVPKTFLADVAGYIGMFIDSEGNRIGIQSMT